MFPKIVTERGRRLEDDSIFFEETSETRQQADGNALDTLGGVFVNGLRVWIRSCRCTTLQEICRDPTPLHAIYNWFKRIDIFNNHYRL